LYLIGNIILIPNPTSGNKSFITPSFSETIDLTSHIPRPVPSSSPVNGFLLVVNNGSKILLGSVMSFDNPGPVS